MVNKHLIALLLFLSTLCTLGPFAHRWWFNGADDFHCAYLASKAQTHRDVANFLYDGHPNRDAGPSNCIRSYERTSFMHTYYRPVQLIFSTWLYWIFDTNAAGFFLFNVLMHAFNTALLFFLLSLLVPVLPSFFAALMFAFHPQIAYRFGALANIQYYLGTCLILLVILLFMHMRRTHSYWLFIPTSILFFFALLCRETYIVLPALLMFYFPATLATGGTALLYLALRLYLYPLQLTQHAFDLAHIKTMMLTKAPELMVCLYDALWLSWLPWGNMLFKLCIGIPLITTLIILFIKNTHKLLILAAAASAGLMLWPGIIGAYSPRYFYDVAPFVLLAYVLLWTYANPTQQMKLLACSCMVTFSAFLICFSVHSFDRRATKLHTAKVALSNLIDNPLIKNRAICFISYPADVLGDQPAEICWVMQKKNQTPILCDVATSLVQANANIVTPTRWMNVISTYYTKNYVSITPIEKGFRYTSSNPQKMYFLLEEGGYSLGKKIIHKRSPVKGASQVTDFSLIIDDTYCTLNPVYVMWDYEKKGFTIVP